MMSFERAAQALDRAMEALPQKIFENLNGGVNLLPGERVGDDGRYILGLYHMDSHLGRYIEIFYGSFAALYPDAGDAKIERELKKTLHHELTHHLESMAGDRTLERWDEEQTLLWQQQCAALEADSVLFYSPCAVMAAAAAEFFRLAAAENCPDVRSAWVSEPEQAEMIPDALSAALALGARLSPGSSSVGGERLGAYDAVLCMTLQEADALAQRYPDSDGKILCLGQTDIRPPRTRSGWAKTMRRIREECRALAEELGAER